MWAFTGIVLALLLAAYAGRRAKSESATYYEGEVYAMDASSHRRWAFAALGFALLFAISAIRGHGYDVMIFSAFAVVGILYGASFMRGYSSEDE